MSQVTQLTTNRMFNLGIYPEDLLFFRSGASFDAGQDNYALSVFPPSPTVLYGAMQSIAYNDAGIAANEIWPDPSLYIKHMALIHKVCDKEQLLYPMPNDLMAGQINKKYFVFNHLCPVNAKALYTKSSLHINDETQLLIPAKDSFGFNRYKKINPLELYIDAEGISSYLNGKIPVNIYKITDLIAVETRTGIGRESERRIVEEGKLYRIRLMRMHSGGINDPETSVGFYLEMNSIKHHYEANSQNYIRLGGERKLSSILRTKIPKPKFTYTGSTTIGTIIKACFITPLIPKTNNYITDFWKTIGCSFIAVCSERENFLSGWDMKERRPKPTYKALPAGTVYFLQITDTAKFENTIKSLSDNPLQIDETDTPAGDFMRQGFGLFFIAPIINS